MFLWSVKEDLSGRVLLLASFIERFVISRFYIKSAWAFTMAGHCKRYLIMCRENFRGRLSSKGEGSRQAETIANFPYRYVRRPLHKPGMCQKLERPRPIYSIYTRLYQTNFHDFSFSLLSSKSATKRLRNTSLSGSFMTKQSTI